MSWRVVIVTRISPVLAGFDAVVRAAGHEPVALMSMRDHDGRYGNLPDVGELAMSAAPALDVLLPARRSSIVPLLAAAEPDLVVCMGFPWKVPADALAVPRLGWINGHPSLLPHHRGPVPVAWAIRAGEEEFGVTFHRMDAELDTGPILAQKAAPLGELCEPEELYPRMGPLVIEVLSEALANLAAGREGVVQDGGDYQGFFGDEDAHLDFSRPAAEVHRLVWAWRYTIARGKLHGALADVDGETVRALASSLTEVEDGIRVECADGPIWLVKTELVEALT
jgi:methionyl-tRNA formyltransferase